MAVTKGAFGGPPAGNGGGHAVAADDAVTIIQAILQIRRVHSPSNRRSSCRKTMLGDEDENAFRCSPTGLVIRRGSTDRTACYPATGSRCGRLSVRWTKERGDRSFKDLEVVESVGSIRICQGEADTDQAARERHLVVERTVIHVRQNRSKPTYAVGTSPVAPVVGWPIVETFPQFSGNCLCWDSYEQVARAIWRRLFAHFARRPLSIADMTAGIVRPSRMPMIEITTSNSTSVNPFLALQFAIALHERCLLVRNVRRCPTAPRMPSPVSILHFIAIGKLFQKGIPGLQPEVKRD